MALFTVVQSLRERGIVVSGTLAFLICVVAQRRKLRQYDSAILNIRTPDDTKVTRSFFRDFFHVAKIALPTIWCKEFFGMTVFIFLFLVKSVLRVVQSNANGRLLNVMVEGTPNDQLHNFTRSMILRAVVSMMTALCRGSIEHLRAWLITSHRERLSRYFQRRFYSHLVYYQATVLDNRLEAADAVIVTYCGEFAEHFAELPYYFVLPFFECVASMTALTKKVGAKSTGISCIFIAITVLFLQQIIPAFGRIHAFVLSREEDHRRMLTNSLNNVECIAMHNGGRYTRVKLDKQLGKLKSALNHLALAKGHFELLEVSFSGLLQIITSLVIFRSSRQKEKKDLNELYVEVQYMYYLIDCVKDFVVNFREISHLSTFTIKLAEFDRSLRSIAQGSFIRTIPSTLQNQGSISASPISYTHVCYLDHSKGEKIFTLFAFSNLKLVTPAGQTLLTNLDLTIKSDQDWVILGENGCGKTSLLRMIAGLWRPTEGKYSRDRSIKLLFAPQHSYMLPQCTLFEQVLFPSSCSSVDAKDLNSFKEAIELAGAQSVIDVLDGLDSPYVGINPENADETYDWDSLSGGQKQRISMARIFYQVLVMDRSQETPVAIMDEATSMMDETGQEVLFNLRRLNVRMLSVTHRDEVIAHHTHALKLSPGGVWSAAPVTTHLSLDQDVQTV